MGRKILRIIRVCMGFIFLWAFFDKTFGLGFATTPAKSWLAGGSPTSGFLGNAVKGPFAELFRSMAGVSLVDWLFMIGLLLIGVSLLFGIYVRLGALGGIILLLLMYLAVLPPENNPIIDDHIIYALVLWFIAVKASPKRIKQRTAPAN